MSLRKAYQGMIKVLGLPDTAMLMEMSESSLDNRVYERKDQGFTVRQALRMQEISKTTLFAEAVAVESGGTFVKLPDMDHIDNESILATMTKLQIELGQWNAHLAGAIANDGEIDKREKAELESIMDEIHRTLNELLALNLRLYSRHDKAPKAAA